ncbi:MAG: SDR family oxidoreductase [Planctomycetota bacterium]
MPSTSADPRKVVLVTGSSSGIGKAASEHFARHGWNVSATMRSPQHKQPWSDEHGLFCPSLDVTEPESIASAVTATLDRFGQIDVLVNNAGYGLMGPIHGATDEQLETQFRTNVLGLIATTRAVLPALYESRGTIVNISSIGGRIGFPLGSAYHATKFAVEGLSESMRYELAEQGVKVRVVEPGGIRTDFLGGGLRWTEHPRYKQRIQRWREFTKKIEDRLPGPEAVARTIFRAATSRGGRLRFPSKPGPYLLLHRWLPDWVWRRMISSVLRMHAGSRDA